MPDIDDFEVCKILKSKEKTKKIDILITDQKMSGTEFCYKTIPLYLNILKL